MYAIHYLHSWTTVDGSTILLEVYVGKQNITEREVEESVEEKSTKRTGTHEKDEPRPDDLPAASAPLDRALEGSTTPSRRRENANPSLYGSKRANNYNAEGYGHPSARLSRPPPLPHGRPLFRSRTQLSRSLSTLLHQWAPASPPAAAPTGDARPPTNGTPCWILKRRDDALSLGPGPSWGRDDWSPGSSPRG